MGDWSHTFSLNDYRLGRLTAYHSPSALRPLYEGKPPRRTLGFDPDKVFSKLKMRLGAEYFGRVQRLQTDALGYAAQTFPEYCLLLEDLLADDWLAIMDWRDFGRDHAVHQPHTAYVATCLLRGSSTGTQFKFHGKTLGDHVRDKVLGSPQCEYLRSRLLQLGASKVVLKDCAHTRMRWDGVIEAAAYAAALFHDCGYPWAFKERVGKGLNGLFKILMEKDCGASVVAANRERLLLSPFMAYAPTPKGLTAKEWSKARKLVGKAVQKTHGVPGAVALMEMNTRGDGTLGRKRDPLKLFCVEWAALAALMHDMSGVYWGKAKNGGGVPEERQLRLLFDVDPLSCIVTLCDLIQEFGRYQSVFIEKREGPNTAPRIDYVFPCKGTRVEWDDAKNELRVVYLYRYRRDVATKRAFLKEERRLVCDPLHGFLNLKALGVDRILLSAELYD